MKATVRGLLLLAVLLPAAPATPAEEAGAPPEWAGRLFGLKDGKEENTFWEFRSVWHPGEKKAYAYQYGGDGTLGVGVMEHRKGNRTRSDQTFFRPDGSSDRVGHEAWFDEDGAQHTHSFDIQEDGTWKKRRFYIWKRGG
jgi:hypothetical protein